MNFIQVLSDTILEVFSFNVLIFSLDGVLLFGLFRRMAHELFVSFAYLCQKWSHPLFSYIVVVLTLGFWIFGLHWGSMNHFFTPMDSSFLGKNIAIAKVPTNRQNALKLVRYITIIGQIIKYSLASV